MSGSWSFGDRTFADLEVKGIQGDSGAGFFRLVFQNDLEDISYE